ncbi:MAG: PKD domain-containing protein [candidate division KSB1 bacterium]|nr:PKD domain-containing protein [candidate division KSB1 bacterium]MDZ7391275.1 PKD domain-containing protein [candidate division KSB1 bacterium]MDZ7412000.1 PKD domain-containing protein [candidate division KSB1 bacterium]
MKQRRLAGNTVFEGRLLVPICMGIFLEALLGAWVPAVCAGEVLSTQGTKFYLDGKRFDMWGVRTVNALWDEETTARFLEALPEYKRHGVNTVGINLQGGHPGFERDPSTGKWYSNSAFNSDGSLKPEYMGRLRRILERTKELDMVVNVGYFYQRQCRKAALTQGLDRDHWDSDQAIYRAVREATAWLRPYRHVFLDIVNEFGHSGYQYPEVFPDRAAVSQEVLIAKAKVLVDLVHEVDPERLCGISPISDKGILNIPGMNVAFTHGHPQPHLSGNMPQVNNEQLNRGSNGVYDEATKATIMAEALQERDNGNYWFWHSEWIQYVPCHFGVQGSGTSGDPGDGWMFRFIAQASVALVAQIVRPVSGLVQAGVPIDYEGEAYDPSGAPITDPGAFKWFLTEVGGQLAMDLGGGRSGSVQIPRAGSFRLVLDVSHSGQSKRIDKLLIAGDATTADFPIGVDGVYPSLALDGFGRVHLVYANVDGVHYMFYDQNGWSPDERIPNSGGADTSLRQAPDVDVDGLGNPHVVWGDPVGGLHYSTRQGRQWSQRVDLGAGRDNNIVVSNDGTVYVVYRGYTTGELAEVHARRKAPGAASFGPVEKLYGDGSDRNHCYPTATRDGQGRIYVVWRWDDYNGTSYDLFMTTWDRGTWSVPVAIERGDKKVGEGIDLTISPLGSPYVAYYDGWVRVIYAKDGRWEMIRTPLEYEAARPDHQPEIAVDGTGKVYVVSSQGDREQMRPESRVVYTVYAPGSGWSTPQPISVSVDQGHGQADAVALQNGVFVVWKDMRGGLYYRILGEGRMTLNQPPVARISAEPRSGPVPLTVQFRGDGSYDPDGQVVSYYWEFGDDKTSREANPVHTYEQAMGYEPRLYVTDDRGATTMEIAYVEVTPGASGGLVENLTPSTYRLAYVREGEPYYVDRDYRVVDVPRAYEGLLWIKTRNADKGDPSLSVRFVVRERTRVYVVHDGRATPPAWLADGFVRTGDSMQVSDTGNSDFRIWQSKRQYQAGEQVTLGPNGTSSGSCSMYVVLLRLEERMADLTPPARVTGVTATP